MAVGSTVLITYQNDAGTHVDITRHVMFSTASFELQFSAVPGTFDITLKDPTQTLGPFVSGREVHLWIDDVQMFGGYVTQVSRKFAFPVDRTDSGAAAVKTRLWVLRGVDYNILFDKRVLRFNTSLTAAGFLKQLPSFSGSRKDGDLIKNELCPKYLDLTGFDYTTDVEDVSYVYVDEESKTKQLAWTQQGTTWRKQMEDFSQFSGAIWYIQPNKRLLWKALESMESRWGFSDVPNNRSIVTGSSSTFQGSTYGFREMEATEDGSFIVNDALVWGGGAFAGTGQTVFSRHENEVDGDGNVLPDTVEHPSSIARHGRWQAAETHFGEDGYGIQSGVTERAKLIVEGSASKGGDQLYGLKNPQWQFRFGWFGHDAPLLNGARDHLTPGRITTIHLYTFGVDSSHPLIIQLPLRQVRISFPELDVNGDGYVRFDGFFGIMESDPWTLWRYLLKQRTKTTNNPVTSSSNSSDTVTYGSFGSFFPDEAPDGVRRTFSISITVDGVHVPIGYISGTVEAYRNGSLQRPQIDYTESDPAGGVITFTVAPLATDWLWLKCRTMGA